MGNLDDTRQGQRWLPSVGRRFIGGHGFGPAGQRWGGPLRAGQWRARRKWNDRCGPAQLRTTADGRARAAAGNYRFPCVSIRGSNLRKAHPGHSGRKWAFPPTRQHGRDRRAGCYRGAGFPATWLRRACLWLSVRRTWLLGTTGAERPNHGAATDGSSAASRQREPGL